MPGKVLGTLATFSFNAHKIGVNIHPTGDNVQMTD